MATSDKKTETLFISHVQSVYRGHGGVTAMVEQIDRRMKAKHDSEFNAAEYIVARPPFLTDWDDIYSFLNRNGYSEKKLWDMQSEKSGLEDYYIVRCRIAVLTLYKQHKFLHPDKR